MAVKSAKKATPLRKVATGSKFTEMVKGSLEYIKGEIADAFRAQFQEPSPYGGTTCNYGIVDTFSDKQQVVVCEWKADSELAPDEYYLVNYQVNAATKAITFDLMDAWEVVELTYQPQSSNQPSADSGQPATENADTNAGATNGVNEAKHDKKNMKRITERVGNLALAEGRTIKSPTAMTAGVVNGNSRRYSRKVCEEAIARLKPHLNESAGQGRLVQILGEVDHPSDKGGRPNLLETVIRWNGVDFDGEHVSVAGSILETSKGKDILALAQGGVQIPLSMRGYGESKFVNENGQDVEEVTYLDITGFDLVMEPGFADAVSIVESKTKPELGDEEMTKEQLEALIKQYPDLFKGLLTEDIGKISADALKSLEEKVRGMLGVDANADLGAALKEAAEAKHTLDEQKRAKTVDEAIVAATKELPYGANLNKSFVEAIRAANPQDEKAVKALVESKRKEYDAIASDLKLVSMGYRGGVQATAPVLEHEVGIPEFARGAHEITERLVRSGFATRHDWNKPKTKNEIFAAAVLERFDKVWGKELRAESKLLTEAETASDLSLPYSVSRTILAQVVPQLVAASVFDFGTIDASPFYVWYETYANETATTATIAAEAAVADVDAWVALAHQRLTPGTVVVKDVTNAITYTDGTDYVIDYANGKIMVLATIVDSATIHVTYDYMLLREGEMAPIQRGEGRLAYVTMEAKADRLADQISSEAIVFGQSQLGWDATARTMNMLINQIRRKIDQGIFYLALSAALSVANNSGGTWDSSASPIDYADLVAKIQSLLGL